MSSSFLKIYLPIAVTLTVLFLVAAVVVVAQPCPRRKTEEECTNHTRCQWNPSTLSCGRYVVSTKTTKLSKWVSTVPSVSSVPSVMPSMSRFPTQVPTALPSTSPTHHPTQSPSHKPTKVPTSQPSNRPTNKPSLNPTPRPSFNPTPNPTLNPTTHPYNNKSGALTTTACMYQDYPYAIDIYWSCSAEKFNRPLRLHTFKRHSYSHGRIFADQKVTYRQNQLWFDEYTTRRCIAINLNGELVLRTNGFECDTFNLLSTTSKEFIIQQVGSDKCVTLGGAKCNDDKSTGGRECSGVDHRYLPLNMGGCDEALVFRFETRAVDCSNGAEEFPSQVCF